MRQQKRPKPDTCTERRGVYPTGISVKVGASYPGRSAYLPLCYRRREVSGWKIHWPTIKAALLNGQYMPQATYPSLRAG